MLHLFILERVILMQEIWKDVVGYEGFYQVSNTGKVRSYDRKVMCGYGKTRIIPKRILKQYIKDRYPRVSLTIDKKRKVVYAHRLVAEAFIPNPNGLSEVNHIDENKQNNNIENLEWCTRSYNNSHGTRLERQLNNFDYEAVAKKISRTKKNFKYNGVNQKTLDNKFIKWWPTIKEAAKETGASYYHLSNCCRGVGVQSGGYKWEYANLKRKEG